MIREHSPVISDVQGDSLQQSQAPNGYYQQQSGYMEDFQEPESNFDPLKILWLAVHYRWIIACALITGIVCGLFFTWQQTPLFKSATKLEIVTSGARIIQDLEVVTQQTSVRTFETARQKILSHDLARRIVFQLNLSEDSRFLAPKANFSLRNVISKALGTNAIKDFKEMTVDERDALAVKTVKENLTANVIRNTSIISIGFTHVDPVFAASVANQAATSFIDQGVDKKSATSDLTREFIKEQVIETKKKLEVSEIALVDYAKTAGITLTGENSSLISSNINEINSSLGKIIDNRLELERYVAQMKKDGAATLPQVFKSTSIQENRNRITELKATYQEKRATLKPGFPEMRRLQSQINQLTKSLNSEIRAIGNSVTIQYEQILARENALRLELKKLEIEQGNFQQKNIQYTILKREVDSNRSQYETLIGKLNEASVGADLKTENAVIIDEAQVPESPFTPRLGLNLAAALALFIMFAGAIIYALELLNNSFAVPDQIEDELKLPVLGILPHLPDHEIVSALENETSAISEAYRTLRSSLQFTGTESSMKSLLVTSSEPSEGKSTTAYKLAKDFANLGKKVLIVDADLRKPRMHRVFKMDAGVGLSNLLTNVVNPDSIKTIFRQTEHPNITFLSAGTIPPNPADLLISQKMGLTIHYCSKKYDMVIIDSPPVMGLSDAPILSRQVDAVLLVVSSKQVSRKAAKGALKRLKSAGANVVGVAMTKFAISRVDYNYAYKFMNYNYYTYEDEQSQIENHGTTNPNSKQSDGKNSFISNLRNRIISNFS